MDIIVQKDIFYLIMDIKITINNENRAVIIPMDYDVETDALTIEEIQIDPMPKEDENISSDVVLNITELIINCFKNL